MRIILSPSSNCVKLQPIRASEKRRGCKWRRLPKEYGKWHVIYKRFNRWVKNGIIERLFRELHTNGIAQTAQPVLLLDSMSVPVHPDACGALKKRAGSRLAAPRAV